MFTLTFTNLLLMTLAVDSVSITDISLVSGYCRHHKHITHTIHVHNCSLQVMTSHNVVISPAAKSCF